MAGLSGFAAGISQGLQNAATFQNIKSGMARDERAGREEERNMVLQKRADEEYADLNKEMDIQEWAARPGGGPDVQKLYVNRAVRMGFGENGKIKKKQALEVVKAIDADPEEKYQLLQFKKKAVAGDIDNLTQEIQGLQEGGGLGAIAPLSVQLRAKQDELKRYDFLDKAAVAERKEKLEEREVAAKEVTAGAAKTASEKVGTISNLVAMRDKLAAMPEGLAKESYRRLIKEQEDFDIKEKRGTHEGDAERAAERQKGKLTDIEKQELIGIRSDLRTVKRELSETRRNAGFGLEAAKGRLPLIESEYNDLKARETELLAKDAGGTKTAPAPTSSAKPRVNAEALIQEANQAIARGADPTKVKKRLKDQYGIEVK